MDAALRGVSRLTPGVNVVSSLTTESGLMGASLEDKRQDWQHAVKLYALLRSFRVESKVVNGGAHQYVFA